MTAMRTDFGLRHEASTFFAAHKIDRQFLLAMRADGLILGDYPRTVGASFCKTLSLEGGEDDYRENEHGKDEAEHPPEKRISPFGPGYVSSKQTCDDLKENDPKHLRSTPKPWCVIFRCPMQAARRSF